MYREVFHFSYRTINCKFSVSLNYSQSLGYVLVAGQSELIFLPKTEPLFKVKDLRQIKSSRNGL